MEQTIDQSSSWNSFRKWWIHREGNEKEIRSDNTLASYGQHPLISPAMNISNCVIAVIDIKTMMYIYASPNYSEFTGWNWPDIQKGGVQFAFSRVLPRDQTAVIYFSELINLYFKKLPDSEKGYYRAVWDYHIINDKDEHLKVLQQDCALKYDTNGQIEELLVFVSKIENVASAENQHLLLTNGKESLFYKYDHQLKKNIQLQLLSEREMEIVKLIAKSKSLKQIAADLKISFNTVKSHSTNMMKKLQVNDALEMVNLLRVWGFI